jgi:hypothetical protein
MEDIDRAHQYISRASQSTLALRTVLPRHLDLEPRTFPTLNMESATTPLEQRSQLQSRVPLQSASAPLSTNVVASTDSRIGNDPQLYTFFELTKGHEIMLFHKEFETGLNGKPSLNSIEAQHGTTWRTWKGIDGKPVNRLTKTFIFRKRVYEKVKSLATTENISVSESASRLQRRMDDFVKGNRRRGLESFAETLKSEINK